MSYGKAVTLDIPFPDAVSRVREALQEQGFGVLTEIDVTATMQAKLGKQIEDYVILGACNPPLAFQALDPTVTSVCCCPATSSCAPPKAARSSTSLDPQIMISVTKQSELKPIADEVGRRLDAVLAALASDAKRA